MTHDDSSEEKRAHDAFVRWQCLRHTQFGYVVNLLLTLTTATLGFGLKLVVDKRISGRPGKEIFGFSLVVLILSVAFGLATNYSRLKDLRETAKAARKRELKARAENEKELEKTALFEVELKEASANADSLGKRSWYLLRAQLVSFLFGAAGLVIGVWCSY